MLKLLITGKTCLCTPSFQDMIQNFDRLHFKIKSIFLTLKQSNVQNSNFT